MIERLPAPPLAIVVELGWKGGRKERTAAKGLVHRGKLRVGMEAIVTSKEHATGKALHYWFGLQMQVSEHGITLPATDEPNGVAMDIGVEQSHGTTSANGAGTDIRRGIAILGTSGNSSTAKQSSDIGALDVLDSVVSVVGSQDGVCGGIVGSKV